MLDENEFLSPYGIRSLSRYHARPSVRVPRRRPGVPGRLPAGGVRTGMFGGNSNWRGPIWMPVNAPDHPGAAAVPPLLRRRLHGRMPDRLRAADEPVRGRRGDRPPAGEHLPARRGRPAAGVRRRARSSRTIPHWRDYLLFYEYFHGDNGPASARATRPAGPASSPARCTCSQPTLQRTSTDRTGVNERQTRRRTCQFRNRIVWALAMPHPDG